ncbi:dihydrofolate reductase, partial [Xylella fastidiosa subsp. multiplex]|nr:dihydrofolate reductase [Xylella fastidiosa subsp. multiplex]
LGRPLPGRSNIVISRNPAFSAAGATLVPTLEAAIAACGDSAEAFVIGGAQIYAQALPLASRILATEVHAEVEGDAFFPLLPGFQWKETAREPQAAENSYAYDFVTYERA